MGTGERIGVLLALQGVDEGVGFNEGDGWHFQL